MEILDQIADERRKIADLVEGLNQEQLHTPSLCGEWSVRDVAAHLLMPLTTSKLRVVGTIITSGGFNKGNANLAKHTARKSDAEMVAGLRANARHPFKPPGMSHSAPLTDLLIHGQDIRRPLGIDYRADDERLLVALKFLTSRPAVTGFVRKGTRDGLRFEATDVDWSYGDGPAVQGPANSLLLALTARPVAFDDLAGPGIGTLRGRVA